MKQDWQATDGSYDGRGVVALLYALFRNVKCEEATRFAGVPLIPNRRVATDDRGEEKEVRDGR